jgi:hypothetical protein
MQHIDFIVWMLGWPLVVGTMLHNGLDDYETKTQYVLALIYLLAWLGVGYLIF